MAFIIKVIKVGEGLAGCSEVVRGLEARFRSSMQGWDMFHTWLEDLGVFSRFGGAKGGILCEGD